ncbi:MAG: redoxin domain-containing protein, partial [Pirellulaceae bacterium]
GVECPLAKLYSQRLEQLHGEYAEQGVAILGVNSNQQDSLSKMAGYVRRHSLTFPLLKDPANRVADQVGARRTPEVIVLDAERKIRYRGRIDDQYQIGVVRDNPTQTEMRAALDQLLAGKEVTVAETQPIGCLIGRILPSDESSEVTYSNQIARIFQNRCVECHRTGEIGPFALQSYDDAVGWAEMIAEVVEDRRMPPWHADPKYGHFRNSGHLSDEERSLIYRWVEAGAPEGNAADLPEPRTYVTGWNLPRKPDAVFNVTPKPHAVQAEGEVKYQYFAVDPGFTEDKWITAAQLIPGNRQVVHHILAFALPPGERSESLGGARGFLVGYVPGMIPEPLPAGMAKKIKAGSRLIFQMHYTPIGSPQEDQSKLGLIFADPAEITHEVTTTSAIQQRLAIPPGADNHRVEAKSKPSPSDETLLLSLMPHMHLRGKSFRYTAKYPDGNEEILVDIPAYDFNWQTGYRLVEPKPMPAGTVLHCVAHFDNSDRNPHNPDPTQLVRWGDQTWDEMMIGYFDIAQPRPPVEEADPAPAMDDKEKEYTEAADRLIKKHDRNGDGIVQREEIGGNGKQIFDRLDTNQDGKVTQEELMSTFRLFPNLIKAIR